MFKGPLKKSTSPEEGSHRRSCAKKLDDEENDEYTARAPQERRKNGMRVAIKQGDHGA